MELKSILVLTDLSPHEDMAVQRASQLAVEHRAQLRVMVHPSRPGPTLPHDRRKARQLARRLKTSLGLPVHAVHAQDGTLAEVCDAAAHADLLVACQRTSPWLRTLFAATPTSALLRAIERPVLLVRKPALANYLRVVAAVDLGSQSEALVRVARAVQPTASLVLFHAIDGRGEAKVGAERLSRQQCMERAGARLSKLGREVQEADNPVGAVIASGEAGRELLSREQDVAADLLVLGRGRRSALAEIFSGSTSWAVLRWGSSDVLVVTDAAAAQLERPAGSTLDRASAGAGAPAAGLGLLKESAP